MKYALLLRGVNVGGVRLPMHELKKVLGGIGLDDVVTYLQTGNVVFSSLAEPNIILGKITKALEERFNYKSTIFLYPIADIELVAKAYPFARSNDHHAYVVFCLNELTCEELVKTKAELDSSIETIARGKGVVYWTVPKGSTLTTAFAKYLAKPSIKDFTTNRNLNTLEKMLAV